MLRDKGVVGLRLRLVVQGWQPISELAHQPEEFRHATQLPIRRAHEPQPVGEQSRAQQRPQATAVPFETVQIIGRPIHGVGGEILQRRLLEDLAHQADGAGEQDQPANHRERASE